MKNITTIAFAVCLAAVAPLSIHAANTSTNASFAVKVTGKGPPVILIPGLSSSGAVWDGTVAYLKDRYQCHVLTLGGFAGQPSFQGPFLETVRKDLANYIRKMKLDHPVIIGHSLGGVITLSLASHDPDLPGPLIIVDSLPFLPAAFDPEATVESAKPMAEKMRADTIASGTNYAATSELFIKTMVTKPADLELVMSWLKTTDPVAAGNGLYAVFSTDLRSDIANIKSPTMELGTWAAYKDFVSKEQAEATIRKQYAQLKNCKIVMADTRHFIMLDDPQWFYGQVDGFLTETGGAASSKTESKK